jgi:hypothetical protein
VTSTTSEARTYGNWIAKQSPGLGRLGVIGTTLLLGALIILVIVKQVLGLLPGLITAAVLVPVLAPLLYHDKVGHNGWQIIIRRVAWRLGIARGQDLYLSSLTDAWLNGRQALPGLLAPANLHEFITTAGNTVAMIELPPVHQYAVMIRVQPDGSSLVDPDTVDTWVAQYGEFLAGLASEPGLVGHSATVQTSPDPGNRLSLEVERLLVPTAPALARNMLDETAETYPLGSASVDAWVTLVFSAYRREKQEREPFTQADVSPPSEIRTSSEMATLIASRLPGLLAQLSASGAGVGTPMSAQDVTNLIRAAYDPHVAEVLDAAKAAGEDTAVDWDHAGPAAAREGWGSYRHDGGASIVWTMAAPPRQTVHSRVLTGLLAPHPAVHCKRVTIIYRPYAPWDASAVIDSQVRTAQGKNDGKAPQTVQSERAAQSAQEEAEGAGLTRFSIIVTSTVRDPTKLGQAGETTMQLSRASKITLRRACGSQAATFAAGLGVGVLLNAHTVIPSAIRDYV